MSRIANWIDAVFARIVEADLKQEREAIEMHRKR